MTPSVPDEYEARTGIAKAEYETRVLASARDAALRNYPPGAPDATIEVVRIEGTGTDTALVIVFRIPSRPECLFGSRYELGLPDDAEDETTPEEDGDSCIAFGVGEYVDQGGLVVRACIPDGITWLPRVGSARPSVSGVAMSRDENRINEQIEARVVRLIGSGGTQHGVKSVPAALKIARSEGLDLVEVAGTAEPPLCKVMDYEKYRREQHQRRRDAGGRS